MIKNKAGLYIHIPFCQKRCYYCDFFSSENHLEIDKYTQAIVKEIRSIAESNPNYVITTAYIGGGTPSLLSMKQLEDVVASINNNFECNIQEFTIEVNPNSSNNLPEYKKVGIDRISLGVQSLNDNILRKIGRLHDSKTAICALETAAKHYNNVSGDLILGIDDNQDVIQDAKSMLPYLTHLSSYMLKVEEGTPLQKQLSNKMISISSEDSVVTQYEKLYQYCIDNKYLRYETSNFSLVGYEGKHNYNYWNMTDYFGVGASAHSFINGRRYYNKPDIKAYINGENSGNNKEIVEREYSLRETIEEFIMLALRTELGLNIPDFNKRFDKNFLVEYKDKIKNAAKYTTIEGDYFRIKSQFLLVQNTIISDLL